VNGGNTWTPRALAELVEGLGGAIVATHSQSGSMGHHLVRLLKEHGNLDLLKSLITIEGSCSLPLAGITAADFANIPYLAFSGTGRLDDNEGDAVCKATVEAISAAGGKAGFIRLVEPGWWQGDYAGPFGWADYVGPFRGVTHMSMVE